MSLKNLLYISCVYIFDIILLYFLSFHLSLFYSSHVSSHFQYPELYHEFSNVFHFCLSLISYSVILLFARFQFTHILPFYLCQARSGWIIRNGFVQICVINTLREGETRYYMWTCWNSRVIIVYISKRKYIPSNFRLIITQNITLNN